MYDYEPTSPDIGALSERELRLQRLADCLESQLTAELILRCLESLAAALDKLHNRGYVCLNLSPETVWIGISGIATLTADCPITPRAAFAYPEPELWNLPKSRAYAAPEVICFHGEYLERKRMSRIGHRADVYSLGLVLCKYLFGIGDMTETEKRRLLSLLTRQLQRELLSEAFQKLPDTDIEELRKLLREMLIPVSTVRTVSLEKVICSLRRIRTSLREKEKTG